MTKPLEPYITRLLARMVRSPRRTPRLREPEGHGTTPVPSISGSLRHGGRQTDPIDCFDHYLQHESTVLVPYYTKVSHSGSCDQIGSNVTKQLATPDVGTPGQWLPCRSRHMDPGDWSKQYGREKGTELHIS